ncbi:TIGR03758 family integrating conjugative element protein [Aquisalimonas sp. 2447]|uniref:TIGR03758 family integrating conjugative element protein n=1 Tax=Aquisalimonas sp. 2447 TaxID=2740807 RepID=UPI0014326507|nr:TIGR03758 family integrating conjugative element protein [Aquisalimonas sp. 2447]QIT54430.1 TIGR03758 family integrating conjugative element protein [Aquisalimonas sp. 2447]
MTETQAGQFAVWAGVDAQTLALAIASVVAVLYILWLTWVGLSQYRAWANNDKEASLLDVTWTFIRAAVVVMIVGFFIRPA